MPKVMISEIQPHQQVELPLVVVEKQLRVARNGTRFLTLKLADRSGEIVGRVWERAEELVDAIPTKGVVLIRGHSEKFRDELQIQIQGISPLPLDQVDPADFLPVGPLDPQLLLEKLKGFISRMKRRSLQQLLRRFLADRKFMERFKRAPAAKSMHHAYLGGLLEHSVSVAELVERLADHYPDLDRDLLLAGAVLHDVGKIDEFTYDLHIDYSHAGRLLGHMVLGVEILEERISGLKAFPDEEALLLKHLILSHHGETEYGAVRLPMTREALALHYADDLDAKMNTLTRILSDSRGEDAAWTPYQPPFQRFFFRGLPVEHQAAAPFASEEPTGGVQLSIWPDTAKKKDRK